MSLAPRSLAHAIRNHFGPSLRISRTESGARALVYEPGQAAAAPGAELAPDAGTGPGAASAGAGARFIDDHPEVSFRQGLLRSAREGFDFYIPPEDRAPHIAEFGEMAPVRVASRDGVVERPGLRLTPEVRARVLNGRPGADVRPRMMFAAGQEPDRVYRTNPQGFRQLLPFEEKWGDPRFNEQDRGAAFARLQEIRDTDWRAASWDETLRAVDDIEEILANHYFWDPSVNDEMVQREGARWRPDDPVRGFFGGDIRRFMWEREQPGAALGRNLSVLHGRRQDTPEDLLQVGRLAGDAVERMLASRRAGMADLLRYDSRKPPKRDRDPEPTTPDRGGFVSALRQAVERLPDAAFARDGRALFNTLRKQRNVTRAELDDLGLFDLLKERGAGQTSRAELLRLIDRHGLRLVRQNTEFDPERPTGRYDDGGTRAFDGPRVPGRGRYFEERYGFPKRRRGQPFPPGRQDSVHWGEGVWGSIRGSVRTVEKFGKGVLGEELQRDYYQAINTGRRQKLPVAEFDEWRVGRRRWESARRDVSESVSKLVYSVPHDQRIGVLGVEADRTIEQRITDEALVGDYTTAREFSARFSDKHPHVSDWLAALERTGSSWVFVHGQDGAGRGGTKLLSPEGYARYGREALPEPPLSDSQSTRLLVRALFTRAAREDAEWVAVPTSATTNRIQANTHASAAHYYDGVLRNVLERVARDLGGPGLKAERVQLPVEGMKRGPTVWMVHGLTPEMRASILEGVPRYGRAQGLRVMTPEMMNERISGIESEIRAAWGDTPLDSGIMRIVRSRKDVPNDGFGDIPPWVGAVHFPSEGRTYIIANAIKPERVRELIIHEIGAHHGLEDMIGTRRYLGVMRGALKRIEKARKNVERAIDQGVTDTADIDPADAFWVQVYNDVRSNYEETDEAFGHEIIAYAAERAEWELGRLPEAHPDRTWWENLLDMIRRWAVTTLHLGELTARDVHTLAVTSTRRVFRNAAKDAAKSAREPMGYVEPGAILRYARTKGFEGDDPVAAGRWLDEQGYFSPALEAARRFPQDSATRAQMVGWLQNQPGVKKDELRTLFLDEFVEGGAKATREEFVDWLQGHRYEVSIEWRSSAGVEAGMEQPPAWGAYTYMPRSNRETPEGYFEAILRPADEDMAGGRYQQGHFQGGLAHVRGVNEASVDGAPSHLLIEVQSDLFDRDRSEFVDPGALREAKRLWRALHDQVNAAADGHFRVEDGVLRNTESVVTASGAMIDEGEIIDRRLAMLPDRSREQIARLVMELAALTRDLKWNEGNPLTTDIPFRHNWPEKAFTDVIRSLLRDYPQENGVRRVAWSTKDAVNSIPGMRGYAGDLYDTRLPRWASKWLGVEVRQGRVDGAQVRADDDEIHADLQDAVALAIEDTRPASIARDDIGAVFMDEFLRDQALNEDFFSEVYNGNIGREDMQRLILIQLTEEISNDSAWETYDMPSRLALTEWAKRFVDRAIAETKALRDETAQAPTEIKAWYFDVTPEVRARALAPRSMYFGRAARPGPAAPVERATPPSRRRTRADQTQADIETARTIMAEAEREHGAPDQGTVVEAAEAHLAASKAGGERWTPEREAAFMHAVNVEYTRAVLGDEDANAFHQEWLDASRTIDGQARPVKGKGAKKGGLQAARDAVQRRWAQAVDANSNDYRTRKKPGAGKGLRDSGAAEAAVGNTLGVAIGGTVTAVVMNEQDREARRAEYERLEEERRKSDAQQDERDQRREDAAAVAAALESGDWRSLPDLDPGLRQDVNSPESMKGRRAYVEQLAGWVEQRTGVSAQFVEALIARETAYTLHPDVQPIGRDGRPLTPVIGYGQFMPDTWAVQLMSSGADYGVDVSGRERKDLARDAEVLALRQDPRIAGLMVGEHARDNGLWLQQRLGRPVTGGELYAAHLLGRDRALGFIGDVAAGLDGAATKRKYAREAASNQHVFMRGGVPRPARDIMAEFAREFGSEPMQLAEREGAEGDSD